MRIHWSRNPEILFTASPWLGTLASTIQPSERNTIKKSSNNKICTACFLTSYGRPLVHSDGTQDYKGKQYLGLVCDKQAQICQECKVILGLGDHECDILGSTLNSFFSKWAPWKSHIFFKANRNKNNVDQSRFYNYYFENLKDCDIESKLSHFKAKILSVTEDHIPSKKTHIYQISCLLHNTEPEDTVQKNALALN